MSLCAAAPLAGELQGSQVTQYVSLHHGNNQAQSHGSLLKVKDNAADTVIYKKYMSYQSDE